MYMYHLLFFKNLTLYYALAIRDKLFKIPAVCAYYIIRFQHSMHATTTFAFLWHTARTVKRYMYLDFRGNAVHILNDKQVLYSFGYTWSLLINSESPYM